MPLLSASPARATTSTWIGVASMATPRYALGAATGGDGRIYAIGGTSDGLTALATVEAYTPSTNSWSPTTGPGSVAPLISARFALAAAAGPDGRIYAIGGTDGSSILDSVEVYTPSTNSWALTSALPEPTQNGAAVGGPDGRIYLIGGSVPDPAVGAPAPTSAVLAFTPGGGFEGGSWTPSSGPGALAPLSVPRSSLGAAVGSTGLIYASGGYGSAAGGRLASAEAYDTQMNVWTAVAPMSKPRAGLGVAADPSGGIDAFGPDSTAEAYSPSTGAWSDLAGMSTSRAEPGAAAGPLGDGRVYAIGGMDATGAALASVEAYAYPATSLFTGDASALYLSGVTLGAASGHPVSVPDGGQHICEARVASLTALGTTTGSGYPGCQGIDSGQGVAAPDPIVYSAPGGPVPTAVLSVNQETVTTQGNLTNGSSVAGSKLEAISLLPGAIPPPSGSGPGLDVLDATSLNASSSASCVGGRPVWNEPSSQIGSLTVAGETVATRPIGSEIVLDPLGGPPGSPGYIRVQGDPLVINPTGGRVPWALVTLNYSSHSSFTNTVVSSPVVVEFPANGPLSGVIAGKVFISYAQSGMVGCHA